MPGSKRKRETDILRTPSKYRKSRKTTKVSENFGRITGKFARGSTTLSRAVGPFGQKKYLTFLYENLLTLFGSGTNVQVNTVVPNSMYDFDRGTAFGNKQPLYYDALLTASGPYKQYRVISWKTTYYFTNETENAVNIWVGPPVAASNETDSVAEVDNWPGVQRLRLTDKYGSKTMGTIVVKGHVGDVYPTFSSDYASYTGQYNTDPGLPIYQNIIVQGADGTKIPIVYVGVKHEAYTELGLVDSLVS